MHALTWGLDVSTNKAKTAAVAIEWSTPGQARVVDVRHPLSAAAIAPLIAEHKASSWAVDVPFGWPDLFVALMADRHHGPLSAKAMPAAAGWEKWRTRQVAQRRTDRFVTDDPRIKPVHFQRRSSCSARPPRCGCWSRLSWSPSVSGSTGLVLRDRCARPTRQRPWQRGVSGNRSRPGLSCSPTLAFLTADGNLLSQFGSDDVCDAVVCALVARARDLELTIGPPDDELAAGRREGWIHVSCEPSDLLVKTG